MWKNGWGNGKKYPWAESGLYVLICVGEREKKLTALKLLQSFLRHIKKLNPQFKKDFKNAKFLTKTSFFLYFRGRLQNGEGNKGNVECICARVTIDTSK